MSDVDSRPKVAGVLLAAGESARLGSPKQLLEFDGEALIVRAAEAASSHCTAGLVVVTGACREGVESALAELPVTFVHNDDWQSGMASSIRHGIGAADDRADAYLILLCDQPRIGPAEIGELVAAWRRDPDRIAAAGYAGSVGAPAVFPARYRSALQSLTGDRGARALLGDADTLTVVDMPGAALDIDTPEDARGLRRPEG